ncbi:MAG: cytochrome c biogenesis protein CcdA [Brumimicrobium sp.]|nr:cytochrome c biogenesis protein CcdA [Brumimicrobium sp.]
MIKFINICFSIFIFFGLFAQEMPEDKVSWDFSVQQNGCEATLIGKLKIDDHWHINATSLPENNFGIPTTMDFKKSKNYELVGGIIEPKPIKKFDAKSKENLVYHEGQIVLKQKFKVLSEKDFELKFEFGFQPCDSVKCLFPYVEEITVKVKGCKETSEIKTDQTESQENGVSGDIEKTEEGNKDSLETVENDTVSTSEEEKGDETAVLTNETPDTPTKNKSLWLIFGLSFASGFAALLTPCVFPMIPMTVSFFTKQSKNKIQGIRNATIYGISIIVIYILLGTLITAIFGAEVLNEMSTNPWFNLIFFALLVFFAISFLGAFEIRLPSSWINKADQRADKGGLIGIFFMALALALVSFSCTGPIVGSLLVQAASEGGVAPLVGMFGFSLALALPFALFAAFPGWMNALPKSGGWLNTVKVTLGFLELALAFKFLSNADLSLQLHLLEREIFLAIWIGIFIVLTIYLFGKIRLPHDSPVENLTVGRTLLGTFTLIFVLYLIPGLWGAPLKLISAFPPPMSYSESPMGVGGGSGNHGDHIEGTHRGPQGIMVFHDYDLALAHAKKVDKPLFVDFTGHNCVNCRRMEESVWGEPGIIDILRDEVVIVSLHIDERIDLPKDEQKEVVYPNGKKKTLKTTGDKWMYKQISEYKITAQPYYLLQNTEGEDLANGAADYEHHNDPDDFKEWLDEGMKLFNKQK